jgi:hypothetical protein
VPAVLAEVQVAVQVVEPGHQRRVAEPRGQLSLHLGGERVDVHGVGPIVGQAVDGERDPGGGVGVTGRHRGERAVRMRGARGGDLIGHRPYRRAGAVGTQLAAIHDLVELWGHGVGQAGQRGDEQERRHQDTGIEVQPQQQGAESGRRRPGRARAGPGGSGGGCRRIAGQLRCHRHG